MGRQRQTHSSQICEDVMDGRTKSSSTKPLRALHRWYEMARDGGGRRLVSAMSLLFCAVSIRERDGSQLLLYSGAVASPRDRQNLIHGCLSPSCCISPPEVFSILFECLCVVDAYERLKLLDHVLYTYEQPPYGKIHYAPSRRSR